MSMDLCGKKSMYFFLNLQTNLCVDKMIHLPNTDVDHPAQWMAVLYLKFAC